MTNIKNFQIRYYVCELTDTYIFPAATEIQVIIVDILELTKSNTIYLNSDTQFQLLLGIKGHRVPQLKALLVDGRL